MHKAAYWLQLSGDALKCYINFMYVYKGIRMPIAARIGDMHTCPMYDGKSPHVGGPIMVGGPTVTGANGPIARVGDMCQCSGPPDVIAKGSATVMVNGMPAARMGDNTVHGGVIVAGAPNIEIGG